MFIFIIVNKLGVLLMKNKINLYLEETLYDTIEINRKTLSRSAYLEQLINEHIDVVNTLM